ncbi:MAG: serine hydrolase [Saprospiraceae bacterium]
MKKNIFYLLILLIPFLGKAQNLYFPPISGNEWDTLSYERLKWCDYRIDSLYEFLEKNNTKSFLLLKDGKIVLEKYFGSQTQNSLWYWASAGKSLTSFLIGLAQEDNKLKITDQTSKYLGKNWTSCPLEKEDLINLVDQLSMTTGLDDGVGDPYCYLDSCLIYKADAGTRWAYHNAPYTLLDSILEISTGTKINTYYNNKIKNQTGISGAFIKSGFNNVFYSTARNMAKYGLLILNKGNWNGNPIMKDQKYFSDMTHSSQNINPAYGYLWWLNGSSTYRIPGSQINFPGPLNPHAASDLICALGKNGQFINVVPSQNIVWIRMGDAPDNSLVPFTLNDKIWNYIQLLNCSSLNIDDSNKKQDFDKVYTQYTDHTLFIETTEEVKGIQIFNLDGKLLQAESKGGNSFKLNLPEEFSGICLIKIQTTNGKIQVEKIQIIK